MLSIKMLYDFLNAIHISEQKCMISKARYNEHRWANLRKPKQIFFMKIASDLEIVWFSSLFMFYKHL